MGGGDEIPRNNTFLPVRNSTASYWRSELHWLDEHRSTEQLPSEADIVIISTGIAGVSTAYHLLNGREDEWAGQPSILLLEARQVCSGATGRNGGHIKKLPSTISELIRSFGDVAAGEIVMFVRANTYAVKRVIEKEGIQAEAELRRSFDVPLDEEDAKQMKKEFEAQLDSDFPLTEDVGYVGEEFAENITSLHGAKAALSTPVLSLWPYKFITRLLALALKKGKGSINLQTYTPVTSISTSPSTSNTETHIINTPRGQIKTPTIIFATNGYTAGLLPQYRNIITPTKATASHITIPLHLSNTYNIRYTKDKVDYLNPRPDTSIIVGGARWTYSSHLDAWYVTVDDSTLLPSATPHFTNLMQRHFLG